MENTPEKTAPQGVWDAGIKVITSTGNRVSSFTMVCDFYKPYVCKKTGEVKPGKWTYVGWRYKRELMTKSGIKCATEFDALLYWLHPIQMNCSKVVIYDNMIPGTIDAIVFEVNEGVINQERDRRASYPLMVTQLLPHYKIIPHAR